MGEVCSAWYWIEVVPSARYLGVVVGPVVMPGEGLCSASTRRLFNLMIVSLLSYVGHVALMPPSVHRLLPVLLASHPAMVPHQLADLGFRHAMHDVGRTNLASTACVLSASLGIPVRLVAPMAAVDDLTDDAPLVRLGVEACPEWRDNLLVVQIAGATARVMLICGAARDWHRPCVQAQVVRAFRPRVPDADVVDHRLRLLLGRASASEDAGDIRSLRASHGHRRRRGVVPAIATSCLEARLRRVSAPLVCLPMTLVWGWRRAEARAHVRVGWSVRVVSCSLASRL